MKRKKLTAKQELFCRYYVCHFNGRQAAIEAGYEEKNAGQQAYQLLKKPYIKAKIKEIQWRRYERLNLSMRRIQEELAAIAFGEIRDKTTGIRDPKTGEVDIKRDQLKASDKIAALKALAEIISPKQMAVLDAMQVLLVEEVVTYEQAQVILNGIESTQESLRALSSKSTSPED